MRLRLPDGRFIPVPVLERFLAKVEMHDDDCECCAGCWHWTGSLKAFGYGELWVDGRVVLAHRVSYEQYVGPIPYGLVLDHLCRNRRCVNPEHLEAVTMQENILRGQGPTAINARKTVCKRGHELTDANTYRRANGYRLCRTCNRDAQRARRMQDAA